MRPALLCLFALGTLAPPGWPARAASPSRLEIVACAPGYPGTSEEAKGAMDAVAAALARAARWPASSLGAVYLPGENEGLARLRGTDAALALVPVPFLLEYGSSLGLVPRLEVEMQGTGLAERWSLVAKKGRVHRPSDLAGFTVFSIAGYAPAFVRGAPGAWGRLPESVAVSRTNQVLSALRKAAGGADVAVLLDGAQAESLASLPFAGELEVLARSAQVPTAVVATVRGRPSKDLWPQLEKALLGLGDDPAGAAALAGIRMVRFAPIDPTALSAAQAMAGEPPR
jgi:hypothetical protein